MTKETALAKRMKAAASQIKFADPEQVKRWEADRKMIAEAVDRVKDHIAKTQPPEQQLFSFMPYEMTRTSPFFPMNRREMTNRPFEKLEWETSWGKMTIEGLRLAVYDESILLLLLHLAAKHRSDTFLTTQYEVCKLANVKMATNTYNAIWQSIDRLAGTKISLETWKGKGHSRETIQQMTGSIISWAGRDKKSGKLKIIFNPYFLQMYGESFVTNIDLKFRQSLAGDPAKALYRFYRSQKGSSYTCHVFTLAKAVNISTELPLFKLRERIRKALRELKTKGFLSKWTMTKDHVVTVEKAGKKPNIKQ